MNGQRPDPDALLARVQHEEAKSRRGRLKIFFGACAGVGKTYAMLTAARQRRAEGVSLLIGAAETHGRVETAALLDGLPRLPSRKAEYRGRTFAEFDLDAALALQPPLIVVDELAHNNIEGSRHRKRWQDVEELLAAGSDVYTTLNVQHLESLNDVVGRITGVRVAETLPDHVFDAADEVTLVDLPPDDLLIRLKEGKVYMPEQAERAAANFFRKGNLIALRELALRRTADRVDAQMRAYRADQAIPHVWQAKERLLVCIGPAADETLVRSAARLAASLHADWIAVYVETPELQRRPRADRARILDTLKLAGELGAETATLAGADVAATLLAYASSRNAGKLVLGRSPRPAWRRLLRPGLADRLAAAREPDIFLIGSEAAPRAAPAASTVTRNGAGWAGYLWAVGICAATTVLAAALLSVFDLANVVMVFLLAVIAVALWFGRGPGALAACLSVAAFDFFFVPPKFRFTVSDTQYLFTFALMLMVALVIGQLAAKLKFEARIAQSRERRAAELAALARELSGALTVAQIVDIAGRRFDAIFNARTALLLPDSREQVREPHAAQETANLAEFDAAVGQWVYDHQQQAGLGTATLAAAAARYLPLKAPMRTRGALAFQPADPALLDEPEDMQLLDACVAQIALALERVHYVEVAQDALVTMESERLRNSLLSAISHDLRTPLTALVGLADTLAGADHAGAASREIATAIRDKTQQLTGLVTNLLDMARLQTGKVQLKRGWQAIEEVVGSALRQMAETLARHHVTVVIPPDTPLCEFDPVLIERVLVNLLDNAAKYTPPDSTVTIRAAHDPRFLTVTVEDDGPGLPPGEAEKLFDKFVRGEAESSQPGVGLGLAICRAIVNAHGGEIHAEPRPGGGARFAFRLPLGSPPPAAGEPS
ncbi:MAG TPA: sensor histidine kinase KdpD [Burkholderiales bacterium]|nr:sensor histidine kinase KdpD [Burkholderiales bacterium]